MKKQWNKELQQLQRQQYRLDRAFCKQIKKLDRRIAFLKARLAV